MELFEQIRRDREREGLSIRELARRHGVHRRAVRQALASPLPPPRKRLRSPEFFDAESFPEIRFQSKRVEHVDGPVFSIVGDLTIKDVTREIDLEVTVQGAGRDPYGNERVALEARGEIDRKDFGLTWNQVLETGGLLVGDAVKLPVDISAVKAAAAQAA